MNKTIEALAAIGALAAAGMANAADGVDTLNQNVWLRVGAFRPSITSKAQIDNPATGVAGSEIEFERDLGLSRDKTLPSLLLGARFGGSWRAELEYFQLKREATHTLDRVLRVDDSTYPVSAVVSTSISSSIARASVGYSFVKTPVAEVGAAVGAHVTTFDVAIDGRITSGSTTLAAQRETQNKTVPLPTLGVYGAFALAPGLAATARVDVFELKSGGYEGRLINAQANLIYRVTQNIGLGLGYRFDDYKLSASNDDLRGYVQYKFKGPQLFVEAGF